MTKIGTWSFILLTQPFLTYLLFLIFSYNSKQELLRNKAWKQKKQTWKKSQKNIYKNIGTCVSYS